MLALSPVHQHGAAIPVFVHAPNFEAIADKMEWFKFLACMSQL